MQRAPDRARGIIDDLNGTGRPFPEIAALPGTIPQGAPIYISGWVYAPQSPEAPSEVAITVDGEFAALANTGFARSDLVALYGRGALRCGFEAVLPSSTLALGIRQFAAVQLIDAMTYRVGPNRPITIARSALKLDVVTPVRAGVLVHFDGFAGHPKPADTSGGSPAYGPHSTISVIGWAADMDAGQPCAAIYAVVDDAHYFRGRYGSERRDVAETLGMPQLRYCGYQIAIGAIDFGPGDHVIQVLALSADGEHRSEPTLARAFQIRGAPSLQ